jgi:AhpC/TSA family
MQHVLVVSLLFLRCAFGQTESDTAEDIRYLMGSPTRISDHENKMLWWAGDHAAVELRRMYTDDFLVQPNNLRMVLGIVKTAFDQRDWIKDLEDREPSASISLLHSLYDKVSDERYKAAITKLVNKLRPPQTLVVPVGEDYWCVDPLTLSPISVKLRKQAPDLEGRDANDKPFHLSDYRGRVVALDIWDTNSQPGVIAVAYGIKLRYQESGLAAIGMWVDAGGSRTLTSYMRTIGAENIDYPVVLGNSGAAQTFGSGRLPMTVLIDRRGKIAAFQSSDGTGAGPYNCSYEDAINVLLAEPVNDK